MRQFAKRRAVVLALAGAAAALAVHAVARASAPAGRYTSSGGTVLDTKTNLTWQQAGASVMNWANAKTYCAGVGGTLGGTGWRLPTEKELLTLVDYSQTQITMAVFDQSVFSGGQNDVFWSATPVVGSTTSAWVVFYNGGTATESTMTINTENVRCVR